MGPASAPFRFWLALQILLAARAWAGDFPVTLTDCLGRTVSVAQAPRRIVSLSPSNTEILFAVGAGNQVAGVTSWCDFPPEARNREKVGGFLGETINVEKILSLAPDLVVSDGVIHKRVAAALENAGIAVFANEPEDFDSVRAGIENVGRLTGHAEKAREVSQDMKRRLETVRRKISGIPPSERPAALWIVSESPLMCAGERTLVSRILELAGGRNALGAGGPQWPEIGGEQVVRDNPDVILVLGGHGSGLSAQRIGRRPGWERVRAVAEGRIYVVDPDIVSRAGPRLAQAVEIVAKVLHPGLF